MAAVSRRRFRTESSLPPLRLEHRSIAVSFEASRDHAKDIKVIIEGGREGEETTSIVLSWLHITFHEIFMKTVLRAIIVLLLNSSVGLPNHR